MFRENEPIFYVYEHWRPDIGVCFWVGKGHGNRAYQFKRNRYYNNIAKKLSDMGMCVEVRLIESGLTENRALEIEVWRIAFWKSAGLTNLTNGGEGVAGLVLSPEARDKMSAVKKLAYESGQLNNFAGKFHKEETRIQWSLIRKGRKLSDEHRAKISAGLRINNGFRGKKHSEETKAKIAEANRKRDLSNFNFKGGHHTEDAKAKIRAALVGCRRSAETRMKMSIARHNRISVVCDA